MARLQFSRPAAGSLFIAAGPASWLSRRLRGLCIQCHIHISKNNMLLSGNIYFKSSYLLICFFFLTLASLWHYCNILIVALLTLFDYEDKHLAQHWTMHNWDQWRARLKTFQCYFKSSYLFIYFLFLTLASPWHYWNILIVALVMPFDYKDKHLAQHWTMHNWDQCRARLKTCMCWRQIF